MVAAQRRGPWCCPPPGNLEPSQPALPRSHATLHCNSTRPPSSCHGCHPRHSALTTWGVAALLKPSRRLCRFPIPSNSPFPHSLISIRPFLCDSSAFLFPAANCILLCRSIVPGPFQPERQLPPEQGSFAAFCMLQRVSHRSSFPCAARLLQCAGLLSACARAHKGLCPLACA